MPKRTPTATTAVQIIEALPPDAFATLVNHALLVDVLPLRLTCKRWNALIDVVCDEPFWRQACIRAFPLLVRSDTLLIRWAPSWQALWRRAWLLVLRHRSALCIPRLYPSQGAKLISGAIVQHPLSAILAQLHRHQIVPIEQVQSNALVYEEHRFFRGANLDRTLLYRWQMPSEGVRSTVPVPMLTHHYLPYENEAVVFSGAMVLNVSNAAGNSFWDAFTSIELMDDGVRKRFEKTPRRATHVVRLVSTLHPLRLDEDVLNHFNPNIGYILRSPTGDN